MRIGIEAYRIFRKYKHGIDIAAIELIRQLQLIDTTNQYFVFAFKVDNYFSMNVALGWLN